MATSETHPHAKKHLIVTPKKSNTRHGVAIAPFTTNDTNKKSHTLVVTVTGASSGRRADVLSNIKKGLKFTSIGQLETAFRVSQKEIAQALSIPNTTLNRRKGEGRLRADESDRVVRLARLKDAALALMNSDDDAAVAWLRTPLEILDGESPLEHAATELGARDVEDLIGRLRHGVFS